nr:hypothetical protein [Tanacetum cinerariifolium]
MDHRGMVRWLVRLKDFELNSLKGQKKCFPVRLGNSLVKPGYSQECGAARSAEEYDRKRAHFRGGKISLGRKKSRESNYGDNTGDGGGAIGA